MMLSKAFRIISCFTLMTLFLLEVALPQRRRTDRRWTSLGD